LRIERIIISHGWESWREIGHAQRLIAAIWTVQRRVSPRYRRPAIISPPIFATPAETMNWHESC
jgi:hypothetical protein